MASSYRQNYECENGPGIVTNLFYLGLIIVARSDEF
jgi:hypothetical protein